MENLPEVSGPKKSHHGRSNKPPLRRSSDRILQQASAFVASLEIIGDGIILLDSAARVNYVSQSAQPLLAKLSEFMDISDNQLRFADESNQKILNAVLEKIRAQDEPVSVNEVMVIARPGLTWPLILFLFALPAADTSSSDEPSLMLIFRDPYMEATPQWQIFARHFALSAQEARLCLALADGLSINEYSERFHLSPHTARTHLKSVFDKTATRRQSDLLRLIFAFTRL